MIKHSDHNSSLNPRINLLSHQDNPQPRGQKTFKLSKFIIYLLLILIVGFFAFSYQVVFTNDSIAQVFDGNFSFFKQLNILAGDGPTLQGEKEDRINVLLLGMGGLGHDGPYLTDTMMLVSIQPSTKKVSMVSIPRDLFVEIPGHGWWKINNANHFGEEDNSGKGGALAKETIEKNLGIPIHYYVRVDFTGFEKMIDIIGGVKINVENSFTDYQYPTGENKQSVISFQSGWQTMDGDTALQFVRSRHGNNGEGSDFARSKRQQKVLQAIKDRVFSYSFLLNPRKINTLSKELAQHLRTDFEPAEIIKLAHLLEKIDQQNISTLVLDDSPGGLLYAEIVNEAYVLRPWGGDFSQIQYLVQNIFQEQSALPEPEIVKVELVNGTTLPGLASQNSQELKLLGYRIMKVGNAPEQNYEQTEIYKLSDKNIPEQINFLEKKYQTSVQEKNIPAWVSEMAAPDSDLFLILGDNTERAEQ